MCVCRLSLQIITRLLVSACCSWPHPWSQLACILIRASISAPSSASMFSPFLSSPSLSFSTPQLKDPVKSQMGSTSNYITNQISECEPPTDLSFHPSQRQSPRSGLWASVEPLHLHSSCSHCCLLLVFSLLLWEVGTMGFRVRIRARVWVWVSVRFGLE